MAIHSGDDQHIESDGVMKRRVDRRKVLGGAAAVAAGVVGASVLGGDASAAPASVSPKRASRRQELPADAAPLEKQIFVVPDNAGIAKVIDFYEKVYERASGDISSDPLVRVDKEFQIQPAGAESWTGSEDGKTWTFKIREGVMWSDGNPVTAADYVKTFQYGADPAHAWDFTWYFQGVIKGWNQVVAPVEGTPAAGPESIGVRVGANEYELIIETENPAPYLPAMLLYSNALSKAALESTGPLYNTKPETAVSSGPFILSSWEQDTQVTYVKNEAYTGPLSVPIQRFEVKLTSPDNYFTMYQNDEVDFYESPAPTALEIMMSDPETAKEVYSGVADFPTFYIFFDVTKAPFDDLKVRQAWSHAIDRDTLTSQVLGPNGTPAYSWLAPGFPASDREGLQSIQAFDPELGKSLLAEAGFPDGDGFPSQQMWLRAPNPLDKNVAAALASMIKQNLNIDIELLEKSQQEFTAALNAKPTEIPLGYVRYGMDFLDPFNMLSVWLSGGRHSWSNPDYDAKVKAAAEFLGSTEERNAMFHEAETILVQDVPGVFVYHGKAIQFVKPWVKGSFLTPDSSGITAMHWPGYTTMTFNTAELYIGADGPDRG